MRASLVVTIALLALVVSPSCASTNPKINKVVVLMLENRSFDHMLGFLHGNNSNIDGCTAARAATDPACSNPIDPTDPTGTRIPVDNQAVYVQPADPSHSYDATKDQVYGFGSTSVWPAPMDGFIKSYASDMGNTTGGEFIMKCFDPVHVPVITTLGSEFAVIDHWFSGIPGPTEVNRAFANSATSYGFAGNQDIIHNLGMPQKTIWETLDDANQDWAVYFEDFPSVALFRYIWTHLDHLHSYPTFLKDAAEGSLPQYTWIEPRYYEDFGKAARDEHPDHDVAEGEMLIKEVYDALRNGPNWNETLLLVTYDEHGGFFDHIPPPINVPNPDGRFSTDPPFNFTRLGVRVPAVVASPWIPKGTVVHTPTVGGAYCHSSIPATVRKLFAPNEPFLTHRDAWAATFDSLLSLDEPRTDCPTFMPSPPLHREGLAKSKLPPLDGKMPLTDLQRFFLQTSNMMSGEELFDEEAMDAMTAGDGSKHVIMRMRKLLHDMSIE